jgi:hypothetical protein
MLRAWAAVFAAAFLSTAAAPNLCAEEGYPSRSIRLVVGFGPGGATDTFGRLLAARLDRIAAPETFSTNTVCPICWLSVRGACEQHAGIGGAVPVRG